MDVTIQPGMLAGTIPAIASKSMAHRLLICAALSSGPTSIECDGTSADIDATIGALTSLGARIERTPRGFSVEPIRGTDASDNRRAALPDAHLDCRESGSTLRFLLPVACALGAGASITGEGRLAERPLSPLYELLSEHGCTLSPQGTFPLTVAGQLKPARFVIPGNVSSQFVSGLLLAAPLLASPSEVCVTGKLESRPYVNLTKTALERFGVIVTEEHGSYEGSPCTSFLVSPSTPYRSPGSCSVEGDWSGSAFWLAAGAMAGRGVTVSGLDLSSSQGDRAILGVLARFGARVSRHGDTAGTSFDHLDGFDIDAMDIPDLVPPIAALASVSDGTTTIRNIRRLRLKESDRVMAVTNVINELGGHVESGENTMRIEGVQTLRGGTVDAEHDHRIAMMASICATRSSAPVTVQGAQCVAKSYPDFFHDYSALGGIVQTLGA